MRNQEDKEDVLSRLLPYEPFTQWLGELWDGAVLRADLIAGITVAMVIIPQSMAYAQLAGLPAVYGLYAAFLPPAVAALFGSSRQLATGPVAMASLISLGAIQTLALPGTEDFIEYSILLALMVGVLRICVGALRLGMLVNLLSSPVVVGFTNAGALIIAASQLRHLLGVRATKSGGFVQSVWDQLQAAALNPQWETLGMAALAAAIVLGLRSRLSGRLPCVLIAAVVTTLLSWLSGYSGAVVGTIPVGLPELRTPTVDPWVLPQLVTGAITITLIGLLEAMAIAKTIATKTRQQVDINQELIGQGMANLAGSFCHSFVVSGSFSRSAVNFASGARTGFSSVVTSLVVTATLLWFTPLLYHLPQATLAVIIITAVVGLVKVRPIINAWRVLPQDGIVGVITFVCTLALAPALHQGIFVGVVLSLISDLYRTMRPRISCLALLPDGSLREAETHELRPDRKIAVIRLDGRLYFEASNYFEDKVLEIVRWLPDLQYLIIDSGGINRVDATGELTLRDLVKRLRDAGVDVYFTNVQKQFRDVLERTGFVDQVGKEHFLNWNQQALDYLSGKIEARDSGPGTRGSGQG